MQDVNISLACIGFLPKSILSEMVNHAAKSKNSVTFATLFSLKM